MPLTFACSGQTATGRSIVDETPLKVSVAVDGSDRNDGLSATAPIATLARAQEVVDENVAQRDRRVEVLIGPGTYRSQEVQWSLVMPDRSITFTSLDETVQRPIFDGGNADREWFALKARDGRRTNIVISNVRVQNYALAIAFEGNRRRVDEFNSSNRVLRCHFLNIGERSTNAIALVNSRENRILDNSFVNIVREDIPGVSNCSNLHALYIRHHSSDNFILRNSFRNCCGDPVRVRNDSNNNRINDNEFHLAGHEATYSEWYDPSAGECPSWNNHFRNNILDRNYDGRAANVFDLRPREADSCPEPPRGSRRLRTGGNIRL